MFRGTDFIKNRLYWTLVPQRYRLGRYLSPEYVDPPADPFEVAYVDPEQITQTTRRTYPAWSNAWELFGFLLSGDWDVRDDAPVDQTYDGTDPDVYLATRFSESVLHKSLEAHFTRNVPWEETQFVQKVIDRIRDDQAEGHQWNGCTTVSDVWDKCERVDNLYESTKERGCLSVRRLNAERGYPKLFDNVMTNEILVDVGRDGELLFVDGRHRLSIAKILDLDEVPVAKLVRHKSRFA